jgi:hypothetical protein
MPAEAKTTNGSKAHQYGTLVGKNGRPHSEYFPARKQQAAAEQHIHRDPEFETFTYGDPTIPKRSLPKNWNRATADSH